MLKVERLTSAHEAEWEKLVSSCPEATFYHTSEWERLLRLGCHTLTPSFYGAWLDNELLAVWPACLVHSPLGNALSSSLFCTSGVPAVKEDLDVELLRDVVTQVSKRARRQSVLRWSMDVPENSHLARSASQCGFKSSPSPRCAHMLDTSAPSTDLWMGLAPTTRKSVKRAQKLGLDAEECQRPDDLSDFLSIYRSTMKRRHLTCFLDPQSSMPLLTTLLYEGKAKLFTVRDRNRVVAGMRLLLHGQTAHGWIAGSDENSLKLHPNELLWWTVIQWISESGFRNFDLGGAPSKQTHGLNRFKSHLGAERGELIRLTLPVDRLRSFLTASLVTSYRRLKEHGVIPASFASLAAREKLYFE